MAWYNVNYLKKKALTIDHTKVSGGSDLSSFPMLISVTDVNLKTVANSGSVQNSSGFDIIFTDSTELTKLDHEIEKYVASTGEIEMWVRIPTLSASSDTVIYLYFDNSSISSSQENKTGVWDSNYLGVWHMNDNAATTTIKDSTSNTTNATSAANTSGKTTTGEIDGALTYNGSSDTAFVALNMSSIATITISCWLNWTTFANDDHLLMEHTADYNSNLGGLLIDPNSSAVAGRFEVAMNVDTNVNGSTSYNVRSFTRPSAGAMHAYSFLLDRTAVAGSQIVVYLDGSSASLTVDHSNAVSGNFANANLNWMCRSAASSPALFGAGTLDEVRVSKSIRTGGWISTEYNNQSNPSTFIAVGSTFTYNAKLLRIADGLGGVFI